MLPANRGDDLGWRGRRESRVLERRKQAVAKGMKFTSLLKKANLRGVLSKAFRAAVNRRKEEISDSCSNSQVGERSKLTDESKRRYRRR